MPGALTRIESHVEPSLTRTLGPFEHLIWLVDRWTPRHFVLVARIEGSSILEQDLNRALLQAQRRHPALRTVIDEDQRGNPHFVPCSAPIRLKVIQRTDQRHWLQEAEKQLATPFEAGEGPLLRAALVQGNAVAEIVFAVHHSIGDGVSAMYLIRDLLEAMEGYTLEPLPPRLSLEESIFGTGAVPNHPVPTSSISTAASLDLENLEMPILQTLAIGSTELEQVLARCRQENTTLQGALLTAVLMSLPARGTLQCLSPVNIRSLSSVRPDDFGLYISSGMASLDRTSPRDFWSLARSARGQVMRAFDRQLLKAKADAMAAAVARKPSPQSTYEKVWRNIGYDAVLTNLGVFPTMPKVNRFRVTAVYRVLSDELKPTLAVATAATGLCITMAGTPAMTRLFPGIIDLLRRNVAQR
jgi:hypothetical protein